MQPPRHVTQPGARGSLPTAAAGPARVRARARPNFLRHAEQESSFGSSGDHYKSLGGGGDLGRLAIGLGTLNYLGTNTPTKNEPHRTQIMNALLTQEPEHRAYYSLPVSAEASMTRDNSQTWYAQAECLPHRDGKHVIIRWPSLPGWHIHDCGRELTGWPVVKIRNVYL